MSNVEYMICTADQVCGAGPGNHIPDPVCPRLGPGPLPSLNEFLRRAKWVKRRPNPGGGSDQVPPPSHATRASSPSADRDLELLPFFFSFFLSFFLSLEDNA